MYMVYARELLFIFFDMGFKSAVYVWEFNLFHSILVVEYKREIMIYSKESYVKDICNAFCTALHPCRQSIDMKPFRSFFAM
jgi:hypothetical protein